MTTTMIAIGGKIWSTDAWNRIVKSFHQKFKHVSFSRQQIQDKEKELKREYRMLKEARQQSGASWDDKLCMIVADPPVWANIITVISKNTFLLPPNYVTAAVILPLISLKYVEFQF
jgi:hypothetical protein